MQTGLRHTWLLKHEAHSYEYDKEINRDIAVSREVTEYEWDYRNRLVTVTEKDSQATVTQVVEYTYDVFDRRIGRAVDTSSPFDMADAVIERYVYDDIHNSLVSLDGGNVVLEFSDPDGSGEQSMALSKRYLYGEAVDQILAQEDVTKDISATDRVVWPLVDNLGTVRDLAKQDGSIATHYTYDSYGNVISGDASLTRYLFTSREWDTATELQYNRARWYDPAVGRWLSEDPIGFLAGDANLQRYVENQSLGTVDPSGERDVKIVIIYDFKKVVLSPKIIKEVDRIFQDMLNRFGRKDAGGKPLHTLTIIWRSPTTNDPKVGFFGGSFFLGRNPSGVNVRLDDGLTAPIPGQAGYFSGTINPEVINRSARDAGKDNEMGIAAVIAHELGHHAIGGKHGHDHSRGYTDAGGGEQIGKTFSDESGQRIADRLDIE